ncbi:hypothetical protein D5S17_20020 [Pseudonocardiaceae bacterium YIM PH 21723]|nr:hypothetical protein D5S17_20020 [Pseudonocardiaceae bacterium YIM PH 21723]
MPMAPELRSRSTASKLAVPGVLTIRFRWFSVQSGMSSTAEVCCAQPTFRGNFFGMNSVIHGRMYRSDST